MWDQEKKHLAVMNKLQHQHRTRPTVLTDVAKVLGYGLGAATALMGKEAAMACTEAVETVIGEHYDEYAISPPARLYLRIHPYLQSVEGA
jgi:ubiquinone biosynthesis monooxygenase Coq7